MHHDRPEKGRSLRHRHIRDCTPTARSAGGSGRHCDVRFRCPATTLATHLGRLEDVARNALGPDGGSVTLRAADGTVTGRASDGETTTETWFATADSVDGQVSISPEPVTKLLGLLGDATVTCTVEQQSWIVECGSRYDFAITDSTVNEPRDVNGISFTVNGELLATAVTAVRSAAAKANPVAQLSVVDGVGRLVTTDSFRLNAASFPVEADDFSVLLPIAALTRAARHRLGRVVVEDSKRIVAFSGDDMVLHVRTSVNPFPPVASVVAAAPDIVGTLDVDATRNAFAKLASVSANKPLRLVFADDRCTVTARSEVGGGVETLDMVDGRQPLDVEVLGPNIDAALDAHQTGGVRKVTVRSKGGSRDPLVIRAGSTANFELLTIVMPVYTT